MPNLNIFFLFYGNSEHPVDYFHSEEDADRLAQYYINHNVLKFTNVRVEKATIDRVRSTIKAWGTRPSSDELRREMDLIQWEQSKNRAQKLAEILDNYLDACSEYHSDRTRANFCLE